MRNAGPTATPLPSLKNMILRSPPGRPSNIPGGDAPSGRDAYARIFPVLIDELIMLLSKEYVGYLAREVSKKLVDEEFVAAKNRTALNERVHQALLDEMSLEDRINDEVRAILEAYGDEMRRTGANYQEMFKKVKGELVRKYKAVL